MSRPRVRLMALGVIVLLIGALIMDNSVWTLPLVIVGVLMLLIAWIGSRLDGHFVVEWGEAGTRLEFRAQIKPAPPERPALSRAPIPVPAPADSEVVEGEAHTVEIDIGELKALIAAAEREEAQGASSDGPINGSSPAV